MLQLDEMAAELMEESRSGYVEPARFQAVSAQKIFRDEIFDHLRVVFQHAPQKDEPTLNAFVSVYEEVSNGK